MQTPSDTTSTMESTAPTSWKWTCSIGTPWALASASPMILNILLDTDLAFSVMSAPSMIASISGSPLWTWWCGCSISSWTWCSSPWAWLWLWPYR